MKKFLSLIMVVAMLVAVFAMVGCNDPVETTGSTTTVKPTTTTTVAPTTTTTVAPTTTTTVAPTTTTTEAPVTTTTTEAPTTETTTTVEPPVTETTLAPEGTTLPIFAIFDWGNKSNAVAGDKPATDTDFGRDVHGFLTNYLDPDEKYEEDDFRTLKYDKNYVSVTFTDDTMKVYAKVTSDANTQKGNGREAYCVEYDLYTGYNDMFGLEDGKLTPGFGGWQNGPLSTYYVGTEGRWQGLHQYAKLRIRNVSDNNIISIMWGRNDSPGSYTNSVAMFLQGGAPTTYGTDLNRTATPDKADGDFHVFYYDMVFHSALARDMARGDSNNYENGVYGYFASAERMLNRNAYHQNNWNGGNGKYINTIRFYFLGASGPAYNATGTRSYTEIDTRDLITAGDYVEVDYIVFGSSIAQLEGYKSKLEG